VVRKFIVGLKHPSSAYQRLEYYIGTLKSKRHMKRIHEYDGLVMAEKEAIMRLSGSDSETVDLAFADFSNMTLSNDINQSLDFGYDLLPRGISAAGDIAVAERRILYVICKVTKPMTVLETGVANGVSSTFILKALTDNKMGLLHSVELPSVALKTIFHKESGWIIPNELRSNWRLNLGRSSKILPRILPKLGGIDMFFHDSNHSYSNMMFEFRTVWPFINSGGLLTCDDAVGSDALLDFADSVGRSLIIMDPRFGAIVK